jgi:hypothetical protein
MEVMIMKKTIFEIQNEMKNLEKESKLYLEIAHECMKDSTKKEGRLKIINEKITEFDNKKNNLLNQIDKINKGKDIKIEYDGEYDWHSIIIDFPKGTSKQFKRNWLWENELPVFSESYHIDSPYDCTGKATCTDVEYIKNKVVLTTHLDL